MMLARGFAAVAVLLLLALPSCKSATPEAPSASFVRQPDATSAAVTHRTPYRTQIPSTRIAPTPTAPTPSATPLDGPMRQIASQVQVARPFPWRYIVVHHSASATGDADRFAEEHKKRGWDGLGYHFVIGNGSQSSDGEIEVGYRWSQQSQGAHAGSFQYNRYGIGVCLVGNFDQARPTQRQLGTLERLLGILMARFQIPAANIIGHSDVRQTKCPGRNLSLPAVITAAGKREHQFAQTLRPTPPAAPVPGDAPTSTGASDFATGTPQGAPGVPYH